MPTAEVAPSALSSDSRPSSVSPASHRSGNGAPESGSMDDLRAKSEARTVALFRRDRAAADGEAAGLAVRDHFLAALDLPGSAAIGGYWPSGSELDCRPLLRALVGRHVCSLPVVVAPRAPLAFRVWKPDSILVPGRFSIPVPSGSAAPVTPDVLLVPLLAFDRRGHRLGQGGGYYDRTLAALRAAAPVLAVGLAYAAQELAAVPRGAHDQPLDWIVTERSAFRIG